jgi:transcriptional regulator with XRE-family HTH domain
MRSAVEEKSMNVKARGELRRRAGMTLFELGQRVHKSAGTLSRWERGQIDFSAEVVEKIAEVLEKELIKLPPISNTAQVVGMLAGHNAAVLRVPSQLRNSREELPARKET